MAEGGINKRHSPTHVVRRRESTLYELKVAIKPYAEGACSLCYGGATKGRPLGLAKTERLKFFIATLITLNIL